MNESQYPTLRFMHCKKCGNMFVAGLDGSTECPECSSDSTTAYSPEENGKVPPSPPDKEK
jgi:hypothetical protein